MTSSDKSYPLVAKLLGLPLERVVTCNLFFKTRENVEVSLTMYGEKNSNFSPDEIIEKKFYLVERQ